VHIFPTFDAPAPGGGATSFKVLRRPGPGALNLGPPCMWVMQSRRTLFHDVSYRKTEETRFPLHLSDNSHDVGMHGFQTPASLFRTAQSERILYRREPHTLALVRTAGHGWKK